MKTLSQMLVLLALTFAGAFSFMNNSNAQSPLQWNYSFDPTGKAIATYPGNVNVLGVVTGGAISATTVPTNVPIHGQGDATSGLQTAINFAAQNQGAGISPLPLSVSSSYDFTTLQIPAGTTLLFNNLRSYAKASSPTDTAISLNGTFNNVNGLSVVGPYSTTNYTSLFHWYTWNLNLWTPEYNRIDSLYTEGCDICLDIGMPPSQYNKGAGAAGLWGLSSVPTTQPNAQNSPLSESYLNGWISYGAIRPLWMAQTNAKLTISNSSILANANQWASPTWANISALTMLASSSVNVTDSSIEALPATMTGRFMDLEDFTSTNLVNDILESTVPIYLSEQAYLSISDANDFGFNTTATPILVNSNWTGTAKFQNETLARSSNSTAPVVSSVASFGGSTTPNLNGRVLFGDGFIFQNYGTVWSSVVDNQLCGYVVCKFHNVQLQTTDSNGTIVSRYFLNDGEDVLKTVNDTTGATAPAFPSSNTTSVGGWTIALGGAGTWGSQCSGLPSITDLGSVCAYELAGNGINNTNNASITSAKMTIRTDKLNTFREYITTNGGSGTMIIRVLYFNQAGNAMSHAQDDLFNAALNTAMASWAPHTFVLPKPCAPSPVFPCTPNGTAQVQILQYVDTGGVFEFLQPTLQ